MATTTTTEKYESENLTVRGVWLLTKTKHMQIETIRKEMMKGQYHPKWYSVKKVSDLLDVPKYTIYRLISEGKLDASRIRGSWRIPREALIEHLEENHMFNQEEY